MTKEEVQAIARGIPDMVKHLVQPALDELAKRNSELDARLREVESRNVPSYEGVYSQTRSYKRGDLVSWGGHIWHADRDVENIAPGSDGWTKAVARGNDGASAYQSAKRCGFAGSEHDWIESLRKTK